MTPTNCVRFANRLIWFSFLAALLLPRNGGAAVMLVTNNNDAGTGSLRQAILDNESLGGGTTIMFSNNVTGSIILTSGELGITNNLTLVGPGASFLVVSGNNASRVFRVQGGMVSISGLTIANGTVFGPAASGEGEIGGSVRGAGVFNKATLSLTQCSIINNAIYGGPGGPTDTGVAGPGGAGLGGAVGNAGTLTMTECTLSNNMANGGGGGIVTSPVTGTPGAGGLGGGGGLYNAGVATVSGCTVNSNSAVAGPPGYGPLGAGATGIGSGGGINNASNLTLVNCTIVDNQANTTTSDAGGGIYQSAGALTLRNCTITGNASATGGGVNNAGGSIDVGGTILAGNTATVSGADGNGSFTSSDYNVLKDSSGVNLGGPTTHTIFGTGAQLGPLQDNGGPTLTRAPLPTSPVIDQGNSFGLMTDQRGAPRPFDFADLPNAGGGDGSDIGAVEIGNPALNISLAGTNVLLFWPSYYGNYAAEYLTQIAASNNWISIPGLPTLSGSRYVLTNGPVAGQRFFRLIQN